MRFAPAALTIRRGETVRLRVANDGKLMHELGAGAALRKHAQEMRDNPSMAHRGEIRAVHVPRRQERAVWTFDRAGEFGYACLALRGRHDRDRDRQVVLPSSSTRPGA